MDETRFEAADDPQPTPAAPARSTEATAVEARAEAPDIEASEHGDQNGQLPTTDDGLAEPGVRPAVKKRRRGSRGGKGRKKPAGAAGLNGSSDQDDDHDDDIEDIDDDVDGDGADDAAPRPATLAGSSAGDADQPELPERLSEGRPSIEAAERSLVRKPQIGDTRPAPVTATTAVARTNDRPQGRQQAKGAQRGTKGGSRATATTSNDALAGESDEQRPAAKKRRRGGKGGGVVHSTVPRPSDAEVDPDVLEKRKGRERNGRPVGRYLMSVQVRPTLTQVAVLEGRNLIEHYVSRPADDISQIHGNIYLGKVQNVLPGMEAAFVDIGTPKNAVLYRGDVQYDAEDIVEKSNNLRIEQMLKAKQLIICQVTKNPIGAKGARLTQEVSLPGRFVVLIPNSKTYGISKRLPDDVRKRLRAILDRVKPAEHGLIVRTAAENATEHELRADMTRLLDQWNAIETKAKRANSPTLLYREPELAVRVIREEFNAEYRGVVIDDQRLYDDVKEYVTAFNPELADRIEFHDAALDGLPLFERQHIHEQLHKALDRKVWLPSGGSLIIEHTEALTVIDVNTGKNVGTTNLEETVYRNNLEAADEVAKQLRLRDIGGIVVIDFIDMEIRENRRKVVDAFRSALARDKTRTQVFDISELGLVEMTRKRIGEGLLTNFADQCPNCEGRGVLIDHALLG
jgi:ribonuclease E